MPNLAVWVADIGSIQNNRFGWCRSAGQQDRRSGITIEELDSGVAQDLNEGTRGALGFECPLFVPITRDPNGLTRARYGEGNRPWSAGDGAGSLATGLTECVWVLEQALMLASARVTPTLEWEKLFRGQANLFVWEAFVTADAKGASHWNDAEIAAATFWKAYPNIAEANAVHTEACLSLIGGALLRSGLTQDLAVLSRACVVLKSL